MKSNKSKDNNARKNEIKFFLLNHLLISFSSFFFWYPIQNISIWLWDPSHIKDPWYIDAARKNWGRLLSAKVFTPLSVRYGPPPTHALVPTPPLSSPTTPVVTTANVWLSASLMYIRLSQVLQRFLSRAVSPVACTLIVVLFFQRDLFISR